MAFFFATPEDLLPVLLSVEALHPLSYTPFGHTDKPTIRSFRTARELPTLFLPAAPHESTAAGPTYLVTESAVTIRLRELSPHFGKRRWAVDQLENPDSTILRHGGIYDDQVLLQGEIRTAYNSPAATRLQRTFDGAIRRAFVKVKNFYVGRQAEALLDAGYRLTAAKQSPPENDLRR